MLRRLIYFLFLIVFSCVEPYEFVITDNQKTLVVEAFISDKSFLETTQYPSDGRFFSARLSITGNVTNQRPELVSGASVQLVSSHDKLIEYSETERGIYKLLDPQFKAEQGVAYKITISYEEELYESNWQTLPTTEIPPMGEISFSETERQAYVVEANERVLKTKKGIVPNITIPKNNTNQEIYYRWDFSPTWIYKAPLSSVSSPYHKCWASDENYIRDYALQLDRVGEYKKDLFFIETVRNERLFEEFSLLIIQHAMNEDYYFFWKEMQDQALGGALLDIPPFNLDSNIKGLNNDKRVSGYFGVVKEEGKRWYFNIKNLSYFVTNTLKADCEVVYGPGGPAPECFNCLEYSFGKTTNVEPTWWKK